MGIPGMQLLVLVASIIVLTNADFKMAQHGARCVDINPLQPMKVCDYEKGLDCIGKSKKWKKGAVCACYGTFVYDKVSKECRRKVGDYCQAFRKSEEGNKAWHEKCQEGSECSNKGVCVCNGGLGRAKFGHTCVRPMYLRGRGYFS